MPKINSLKIFSVLIILSLFIAIFPKHKLFAITTQDLHIPETSVEIKPIPESSREATVYTPSYAQKAYEYSNMMNNIRNMEQTRSKRLENLIKTEHKYNNTLRKTKLITTEMLQQKYGRQADPKQIEMLKTVTNLSILTRIRYSTATEGFLKLLTRVNKNLDDRENFGFDVTLYVSDLEGIEDLLINTNSNAEAIIFQLPSKEDLNTQNIMIEMQRVKTALAETQSFHITIQSELIKLIELIQNG